MHDCRPLVRAAMLALCLNSAAMAHQSLVGEFDTTIDFQSHGADTEVQSLNPHLWPSSAPIQSDAVESRQCDIGDPAQLISELGTAFRAQPGWAHKFANSCFTHSITDTRVYQH